MTMPDPSLNQARAALREIVGSERESLADLLLALGLSGTVAIERLNDGVDLIAAALARLLAGPLDRDDRAQLRFLLIHLVGRLLVERHDGMWMIGKDPASRHYGRVVIGAMRGVPPGTSIQPGLAADDLLAGQTLPNVLAAIEQEIGELPR